MKSSDARTAMFDIAFKSLSSPQPSKIRSPSPAFDVTGFIASSESVSNDPQHDAKYHAQRYEAA